MPRLASSSNRIFLAVFVSLVVSAAYLYAYPQANVFYAAIVLLHTVVGVAGAALLFVRLLRKLKTGGFIERLGWLLLTCGAIPGLVLIRTGALRANAGLLSAHIVLCAAGAGILFSLWVGGQRARVVDAGDAASRVSTDGSFPVKIFSITCVFRPLPKLLASGVPTFWGRGLARGAAVPLASDSKADLLGW